MAPKDYKHRRKSTKKPRRARGWLWFLAGISRRINLHWFLGQFMGRFYYRKPDIIGPARRKEILDYYKEPNKAYADLIGMDLSKYGYY